MKHHIDSWGNCLSNATCLMQVSFKGGEEGSKLW